MEPVLQAVIQEQIEHIQTLEALLEESRKDLIRIALQLAENAKVVGALLVALREQRALESKVRP